MTSISSPEVVRVQVSLPIDGTDDDGTIINANGKAEVLLCLPPSQGHEPRTVRPRSVVTIFNEDVRQTAVDLGIVVPPRTHLQERLRCRRLDSINLKFI